MERRVLARINPRKVLRKVFRMPLRRLPLL
jgi:hypothetical protein